MPLIFPAPRLLQLHKHADCSTAGGSYTNRIFNAFRVKKNVEIVNVSVIEESCFDVDPAPSFASFAFDHRCLRLAVAPNGLANSSSSSSSILVAAEPRSVPQGDKSKGFEA